MRTDGFDGRMGFGGCDFYFVISIKPTGNFWLRKHVDTVFDWHALQFWAFSVRFF
jgi:hypothetical protein